MKRGLCLSAEASYYELLIAGIAIAGSTAVIGATVDASIAAAVTVGKIMYPDYHDSDNHNDPKSFAALEESDSSTIIA